MDLKFGDILLTYGRAKFWPPKYWILWIVYDGIKGYQKRKWGWASDYKPTHVRIHAGKNIIGEDKFFESTTPTCQFATLKEINLEGKTFKIVRLKDMHKLNHMAMKETMKELNGLPYDKGDLFDFLVNGFLFRKLKNIVRILGDREKKFKVCSTAVASILKDGGMVICPETTDPAFFVNRPDLFETIYEG